MQLKMELMKENYFFLRIEEQIGTIQKYKCKKCGKVFYLDLSLLVYANSNITSPVIDYIENLYRIYGV